MSESDEDEEASILISEGALQGIGFMFDEALPKLTRQHSFLKPDKSTILVTVACVDDTPGALQSGHYVWPAAPALCQYLLNSWSDLNLPTDCKVLELGAGCGLVGLMVGQLPGISSVTFTDHDPGTLKLIKQSIELQADRLKAQTGVMALEWGLIKAGEGPLATHPERFDLLVGSDLIYCAGVVKPLLQTIHSLLAPTQEGRQASRMVLLGSFVLTPDCEAALREGCADLGLQREVVKCIGPESPVWLEFFRPI